MDPTQGKPVQFPALVGGAAAEAEVLTAPTAALEVPLNGEVIPPALPDEPTYPIGLVDFNKTIVVMDYSDEDETFDKPQILAVLKGSMYPVVVTFWKNGEQCVAQFNTDGEDEHCDYKVENDEPYPRTIFVVIGLDGRSLYLDEEAYSSEDAARSETNVDNIVAIFPLTIEAPPVALSDFHNGGVESDEESEDEALAEAESHGSDVSPVVDLTQPPTEMYVAGRTRRIGETVSAFRNGFGTRTCLIIKMRRDSHKSLYLDPQDGNPPYWAFNKNVRNY